MWRRKVVKEPDRALLQTIPQAEFNERHSRRIRADPDQVWASLHQVSLSDLPITSLMMRIRRGFPRDPDAHAPLLTSGPMPVTVSTPPHYAAGVTVGAPWKRIPSRRDVCFDDAAVFDDPGWLVYGTDYRIEPLGINDTLLITETRCHPTSPDAHRAFRRYWIVIRVFSGLVRHETLRAVARAAESHRMPK